ncbi:hypothetical protein K493DRAFT_314029 [Basidiobolus meristosporus CBS 931.73]|uniref:Uncharacterized protein n=1 Tax=Basidiobolus meristosporus CBS 931.73 TaxID=1314790 RepID=A0A1Y1YHS2_9FUNG|nr:hypothetical protein K493DRAFT_314029 [Basidiobolus meristosporus CBS 931.73]|eukprot:ORX97587.1 hypothetical protein K493DRAFT_314029 [Basidiobolus meristosporus CBS 931.73]
MTSGTKVADIIHRTAVLCLAGFTVYGIIGNGVMLNRNIERKRERAAQQNQQGSSDSS